MPRVETTLDRRRSARARRCALSPSQMHPASHACTGPGSVTARTNMDARTRTRRMRTPAIMDGHTLAGEPPRHDADVTQSVRRRAAGWLPTTPGGEAHVHH